MSELSELFADYRCPWESEDQRLLRKHAASFFRKEATPNQERWAEQHHVDREFWTKAGAAGPLCLELPQEYGGGDGQFGHETVVTHGTTPARDSALWVGVHSTIFPPYIPPLRTDQHKVRRLPP